MSDLSLLAGVFLAFAVLPLGVVDGGTRGEGDDAMVYVSSNEASAQGAPVSGGGVGDRWQRHAVCLEWYTEAWDGPTYVKSFDGSIPDCVTDLPREDFCPDGEGVLNPWWRSQVLVDGSFGPWVQVGSYQCVADLIYAQVAVEWAQMPITPTDYRLEPATGWAIAELGVNPIADGTPQTMDTTILGTPVIIRAVPVSYTWSGDDGTNVTLMSPGKPYADGGTPFSLPKHQHRATLTLTTTWRGEYSINGGASWSDAPGTATTTSASTTLHVYNPHTHLVDCDLNGNCLSGKQAPKNPRTLLDPDGDGIDNFLIPDHLIDDYLSARDGGDTWSNPQRKTIT
jgi:hypothetical protein